MVMVPRPRATRPSFSKYLSMRDTTSLAVPRFLAICSWVVEMVLLLGSLAMEGVYYFLSWRVFSDLSFHTQGFKPAIVLPLVCLLFAYLAARAVFRDELLVRAADRIR